MMNTFSHVETERTPAVVTDGQTDGQTDRRRAIAYAAPAYRCAVKMGHVTFLYEG